MSTVIPADVDQAVARLRQWTGEDDVENSTWDRDQLVEILTRHEDLEGAAADAWGIKASRFANLVNVSEGGTRRDYSKLSEQARAMVDFYNERTDEGGVIAEGETRTPRTRAIERA
jgi:hypothetical protein